MGRLGGLRRLVNERKSDRPQRHHPVAKSRSELRQYHNHIRAGHPMPGKLKNKQCCCQNIACQNQTMSKTVTVAVRISNDGQGATEQAACHKDHAQQQQRADDAPRNPFLLRISTEQSQQHAPDSSHPTHRQCLRNQEPSHENIQIWKFHALPPVSSLFKSATILFDMLFSSLPVRRLRYRNHHHFKNCNDTSRTPCCPLPFPCTLFAWMFCVRMRPGLNRCNR